MKNSVLAVALAGTIILIALGVYVYTSSQSVVSDSNYYVQDGFTSSEIAAFNSNFNVYQGVQTGSQVRALLTYVSANAKTFEDEEEKVPTIYTKQISIEDINEYKAVFVYDTKNGSNLDEYVSILRQISNKLELKHTYRVVCQTDEVTGLIHTITINYDKEDTTSYVDE